MLSVRPSYGRLSARLLIPERRCRAPLAPSSGGATSAPLGFRGEARVSDQILRPHSPTQPPRDGAGERGDGIMMHEFSEQCRLALFVCRIGPVATACDTRLALEVVSHRRRLLNFDSRAAGCCTIGSRKSVTNCDKMQRG